MDKVDKLQLSESDICDLFISPAIKQAGWDQLTQMRREVTLTPGPVIVRGNLSSRNKKKKKFADYVLSQKPGLPLAVVEAKANAYSISSGLQQALGYAELLDLPSAFSSNGDGFASHNRAPIEGEDIETEFALHQFPSPSALWEPVTIYEPTNDDDPVPPDPNPIDDDEGGNDPEPAGTKITISPFSRIGTPVEIINGAFGGRVAYEGAVKDLEDQIYRRIRPGTLSHCS